MMIEIREGTSCTVGSKTIAVDVVRESPFANREGGLETRRTAMLSVGGEPIEVEEGSRVPVDGSTWRVVRVRRKGQNGLVRMRGSEDDLGRFTDVWERALDSGGRPWDARMLFLVEGVRVVHDVVSRLDDHPDVVGTFADPLAKAQKYLAHARSGLAAADASSPLLAFADRYLEVCPRLIEIIMNSTQETE